MKIVFITREGYNLPGARIRCYNFSRELAQYGIATEVLSFSDNLGAKDGEKESQMRLRDKIMYNYKAFRRLKGDKDSILYIQRLNYHSFAPYSTHIFNKNKIILDLDDWEMRENPKYYFGIYPSSKAHYITRQIAKKSIFCIAASRFLQDFLLQYNKKVYYIPSGVDTELFKPNPNDLNKKEIIFAWIGTFHKKEYIENIKFALDCFISLRKKYSHIYFDIVGDGIYKNDLIEMLKRLNDSNIRLKGWLHPDRMPKYLSAIHVGLLPVASDTKFNKAKSPTKLFEYMAMAKPTICSDIGEAKHIITDGKNGFIAYKKEEYIRKMQRLVEDYRICQQIGIKARQTVQENYSLEVLVKYLYEKIRVF